ncbi:hypothetical protein Sjap_014516 [Stephania japonica]|uniref:4-coumarate--CoA ligase n=1 Tax=Stephania japonica TaxID=461633 RepID=A0AAP0NRJ2_9MAGN
MDELKPSAPNSPPLTPLGFLDRAATVYGDSTSIIYNETSYTWAQTHRRCLQLASSLVSLGIKPGHVVSVLAPNVPPMYELHFAVPMSGAVLNTINIRLDLRTVSILLHHSESKLVFVDPQFYSVLRDALKDLIDPPIVVLITDIYFDAPLSPAVDHTYEGLIEMGDPEFKWVRPKSEWDPMVLNYTSGTTSTPKGVVHCHRGLFIVAVATLVDWAVPKQPVYLWTLPMFHANGWSFPWGMAAVGGTNICLRKVDVVTIYDEINKYHVTHMCGAPVVLNMLANDPNREQLTRPVHILTAGSPPPAAILLRTESIGFKVDHGYGLTETGGIVVSCAWKDEWNRFPLNERARLKARQGVRTIGMTEIDVVDSESGVSVTRDGSSLGEVVLRGGSIMLGYLKDPVGTTKCMDSKQGWFYTGDVGVIHPDDYLEIKDRSKDVIISGGENVSSVEVESVLYSHPLVNEAAVVAQPDEFWGETPCAFVSLKVESNRVTEKEIIEYCRQRMAHYMAPKSVVFKDKLPRTSTGKIQKFVLRDMAKSMSNDTLKQ